MKIGYLRVSTEEQRPDRQIDGLTPLCDELFVEKCSDTLVVWDVDRAFRSTVDAIHHAKRLRERGIEFQIVSLGVASALVALKSCLLGKCGRRKSD
ncbi:MAG: recombinase family protein [Sulfitobacter sp.]